MVIALPRRENFLPFAAYQVKGELGEILKNDASTEAGPGAGKEGSGAIAKPILRLVRPAWSARSSATGRQRPGKAGQSPARRPATRPHAFEGSRLCDQFRSRSCLRVRIGAQACAGRPRTNVNTPPVTQNVHFRTASPANGNMRGVSPSQTLPIAKGQPRTPSAARRRPKRGTQITGNFRPPNLIGVGQPGP